MTESIMRQFSRVTSKLQDVDSLLITIALSDSVGCYQNYGLKGLKGCWTFTS